MIALLLPFPFPFPARSAPSLPASSDMMMRVDVSECTRHGFYPASSGIPVIVCAVRSRLSERSCDGRWGCTAACGVVAIVVATASSGVTIACREFLGTSLPFLTVMVMLRRCCKLGTVLTTCDPQLP